MHAPCVPVRVHGGSANLRDSRRCVPKVARVAHERHRDSFAGQGVRKRARFGKQAVTVAVVAGPRRAQAVTHSRELTPEKRGFAKRLHCAWDGGCALFGKSSP